jgi:hypothetical protein
MRKLGSIAWVQLGFINKQRKMRIEQPEQNGCNSSWYIIDAAFIKDSYPI